MEEFIIWLNKNSGILTVVNTLVLGIVGFFLNRSQERLKSQLNAKFHAHTVRFEKEFEVLQSLWAAAVKLRNATVALNPSVIPTILEGPEETQEEMRQRKLIHCAKARDDFYKIVDDNRPFYDQKIRESLEALMKTAFREASQTEAGRPPLEFPEKNWAYSEASEKNRKAILEQIDELEEALRKRIRNWGSD
jgi:hypothetical protein